MADLTITAANVVKADGAETATETAGEAITAGQTLYRHTDSKLYKAKDDTAAHAAAIGVALNSASANQPVTYVKSGDYNPGAAVAVGTFYGVTDTAGGLGVISDRSSSDFVTVVGYATTTSNIKVAITQTGVAVA